MIRRHIAALRVAIMAVDATLAMAVFVGVSIARFGSEWPTVWTWTGVAAPVAMAAWAFLWSGTLWLGGLYRLRARWSARADAFDLVHAAVFVALILFGSLFIVQLPRVSRLFLVGLLATQLVVDVILRVAIREAFALARNRGLNTRYVLMIGTTALAEHFADLIEQHTELGLRVVGHLHGSTETGFTPRRRVLGSIDGIEQIIHAHVIDEVAICLPPAEHGLVEAIARVCEDEGKMVRIPLAEPGLTLAGARAETFEGLTVLSLVRWPDRMVTLLGKRAIDVVGATLAIVVLSPLLVATALGIRLSDGPHVLFRQERIGLHGRAFGVFKFRTMVPDAEARLEALLDQNEVSGHAFKMGRDPRITRVGRWLRRTSLDELPQLFNVVRGEMSLVGPRPPLAREVDAYDVWHRRRLSMKPGMTGLWQVSARNSVEFDRWVEVDLEYIDRWSLLLDLKIMVRTVPAMIQGR